jgi:ribosome-binding factor A
LGFVTITHVELTDDYRYAKIFFSVLGQEEEHKKTKEALDSALGFIRMLIAKRIRLRFAPELAFKEDRSGEYGSKIERILEEIRELSPPPIPFKRKRGLKKSRKVKSGEPKKSRRVRKKK